MTPDNGRVYGVKGRCAVCGKENTEVFVAASTCGAVSFAYCADCLRSGAEPYDALVSYISWAGDKREDINAYYLEVIDATLQRLDIPEEQFWQDVRQYEF